MRRAEGARQRRLAGGGAATRVRLSNRYGKAPLDIAAAFADPDQPDRIRDEFNSGDGLHVNDAGAKAIADAVDVSLLDL